MRLHRFYVPQPLGEDVVIDDVSTIKQWVKVFRYTKGDFVILFNGEGIDVTYILSSISSSLCTLVKTKHSPAIVPTRNITLYLSVIKKDNFELVVQKATELGVTTIVPILSERSEKKNLNEERLKTIATEALEQSGRGDVITIQKITSLPDVLSTLSGTAYLCDIGGKNIRTIIPPPNDQKTVVFIGPEGGWTAHELELFKEKGVYTLSLGKTVLRAETAAIVTCGFLCA